MCANVFTYTVEAFFIIIIKTTLHLVPEVQDMTVIPHYSRMNVNASDILSAITIDFQHELVS